jgi:phytoene desaturase
MILFQSIHTKENAYGMANTLQTAFLRPKLKVKKVKNLYFTGQLTVPDQGSSCINFWKLVSDLINKQFSEQYEKNYSTMYLLNVAS